MWHQDYESGTLLRIRVIPKAKENNIVGIHADFLKVKIQAAPEKGKANRELVKLLADTFDISQNRIKILKGQKHSLKTVFVPVDPKKIKKLINSALTQSQGGY